MTQDSGGRNPGEQDNPPEVEDEGQEAPDEISDDELAEGLTEEDEDNPEQEDDGGTPEEPEEKPDEEEYAAGRFAADNAKTRLADGTVTTIAELKNGNLLQSDYTQKTMALAEERKTVEATKANFAAAEQAIAQQRETLAMIINRKLPKPPDPAMLNPQSGVFDVVGYMAAKEDYEQETKEIQQMIAQHQQMLAQQAQEAEEERSRLRDQEAKLLFEKQPDLKDPQNYQKFWARMVKYAAKRGFTPEELDQVDDHRTYGVLDDAMKYRRPQGQGEGRQGEDQRQATGFARLGPPLAHRRPSTGCQCCLCAIVEERLHEGCRPGLPRSRKGQMNHGCCNQYLHHRRHGWIEPACRQQAGDR